MRSRARRNPTAVEGNGREEVRSMLLRQRAELLTRINGRRRGISAEETENHNRKGDMADVSSCNHEQLIEVSLLNQAWISLADVNHALARLEAGLYVQCQGCGHEIPEKRLKALPTARRCVPCEEKH